MQKEKELEEERVAKAEIARQLAEALSESESVREEVAKLGDAGSGYEAKLAELTSKFEEESKRATSLRAEVTSLEDQRAKYLRGFARAKDQLQAKIRELEEMRTTSSDPSSTTALNASSTSTSTPAPAPSSTATGKPTRASKGRGGASGRGLAKSGRSAVTAAAPSVAPSVAATSTSTSTPTPADATPSPAAAPAASVSTPVSAPTSTLPPILPQHAELEPEPLEASEADDSELWVEDCLADASEGMDEGETRWVRLKRSVPALESSASKRARSEEGGGEELEEGEVDADLDELVEE